MPSEDTKMLKFNQYQMSDEVLFVIYADLECLVEKIGGCKNNSESSYTTAYWVFQCLQYHHVKAQKISMMYTEANVVWKKFCESLRVHTMKIIMFKKKILLSKELQQSYKNPKICYICKEKFENKHLKDK